MLNAISNQNNFISRDKFYPASKHASATSVQGPSAVVSEYVDISSEKNSEGSWQPIKQFGKTDKKQESFSSDFSDNFKRKLINYLENQGGNLSSASSTVSDYTPIGKKTFDNIAPVTTSLADGTAISISPTGDGSARIQLSLANGQRLEIENISSDVRFTTNEHGQTQMVSREATTTFDNLGNIIATEEGGDPLQGTDANDIIVNFNGTEVNGGAGNDLIINYSSQSNIYGGTGNDKVVIPGAIDPKLNIYLGDGDDSIEIDDVYHADITIDGGRGNDNIKLGNITGDQGIVINGGAGQDNITIGRITGGDSSNVKISGGSDNDKISVSQIITGTFDISGDEGDDKINVGASVGRDGLITGGKGNDTIEIGTASHSVIDGGDGDNAISVENMFCSLLVNGSGSDSININTMLSSMILSPETLGAQLWEDTPEPIEHESPETTDAVKNEGNLQADRNDNLKALILILSRNSNTYGFTQKSGSGPLEKITAMNNYL